MEHFGRVDILVVSAGTAVTRPSLEVTPEEWDQVLNVNLRAVEWSQYGITVNAIAPGYVKTAMNEDALTDQRVMDYIIRRTPMRRLGTADG